MAYFNSWSTGMRVDPAQLIIIVLLMMLACAIATPLTHKLLRWEDAEVAQAQARAQSQTVAHGNMWVGLGISAFWIAVLIGMFAIGMHHY